ncbi:MAG: hypothetical protein HYV96_18725 [Opitutae bacterium]|nr:hypothetical protein [Opitutae bacterium]
MPRWFKFIEARSLMCVLRRTLFWLHLAAGLIAGVVIGIMCVTGAALAWRRFFPCPRANAS